MELSWQEKFAMMNTQTKLINQFGLYLTQNYPHAIMHPMSLPQPPWYYFSHPSNLAFHHFTIKHKKGLHSLLGVGPKFIPTPTLTNSWTCLKNKSYSKLFRSIHLRFDFAGKSPNKGKIEYDPKMYVHSTWTLPHWTIPLIALEEHLSHISNVLGPLFKTHKGKTNLLPYQYWALCTLQQQQTFLIIPCNKILGPAIIKHHDCLKITMRDHLQDTTTHKTISQGKHECYASEIHKSILNWLKEHPRH